MTGNPRYFQTKEEGDPPLARHSYILGGE